MGSIATHLFHDIATNAHSVPFRISLPSTLVVEVGFWLHGVQISATASAWWLAQDSR
jgi:hypothetical protein